MIKYLPIYPDRFPQARQDAGVQIVRLPSKTYTMRDVSVEGPTVEGLADLDRAVAETPGARLVRRIGPCVYVIVSALMLACGCGPGAPGTEILCGPAPDPKVCPNAKCICDTSNAGCGWKCDTNDGRAPDGGL